jgi:hypothetical protein
VCGPAIWALRVTWPTPDRCLQLIAQGLWSAGVPVAVGKRTWRATRHGPGGAKALRQEVRTLKEVVPSRRLAAADEESLIPAEAIPNERSGVPRATVQLDGQSHCNILNVRDLRRPSRD